MEIKSIWEKQITWRRDDGQGGHCALGWLDATLGRSLLHEDVPAVHRVAAYLRANYSGPMFQDSFRDAAVIATANNLLPLTPEDFRRIDRETQIAEGMAKVNELLDSTPLDVTKECVLEQA